MSRILSRVAGGALGIVLAAAAGNVALARAQQAPTGPEGPPLVSTDCGSGTYLQCAVQKTYKCEWTFNFGFVWHQPYIGLHFTEKCVESGERPIYKDKASPIPHGGCTGVVSRPPGSGTSDEECA